MTNRFRFTFIGASGPFCPKCWARSSARNGVFARLANCSRGTCTRRSCNVLTTRPPHPPPSFLPPFAYRLQATGPTPATHSPCRPYVDRPPSTATHHHLPHTTPTHPPHHITKHDGRTTTNVSPTRRPQQRLWLQCLPSADGLRGSRERGLRGLARVPCG